jgi:transcriptional regulator with XRE-family HTH domain
MPPSGQTRLNKHVIDKSWLVDRLTRLDLTQRSLAEKIGMSASTLNQTLNGRRLLQHEEVGLLAEALNTTVDEIFSRFGFTPLSAHDKKIRITGRVNAALEILPLPPGPDQFVKGPKDTPPDAEAVRVDDRTSPYHRWVFVYEPASGSRLVSTDSLCVCGLESGKTVIRIVEKPGSWVDDKLGIYDLRDFDNKIEPNVKIVSASPVLWINP